MRWDYDEVDAAHDSTVSDTASEDAGKDASGPLVARLLSDAGYDVTATRILPDDLDSVHSWVQQQADARLNLVVCTGGTGFGVRDQTPEVRCSRETAV